MNSNNRPLVRLDCVNVITLKTNKKTAVHKSYESLTSHYQESKAQVSGDPSEMKSTEDVLRSNAKAAYNSRLNAMFQRQKHCQC